MINRLFLNRYLFHSSQSSVVRTLSKISVSGIALGVLTMIVVLSVMSGFDEAIENRILKAQPHLVITTSNPSDLQKAEKLITKGTLESFSRQDVIVRTLDGIFSGAIANGIDPERLNKIGRRIGRSVEVIEDASGYASTAKGKVKSDSQPIELKRGEIAVGADLARSLGIFEGDEVTLVTPESLLVVGETPTYEKVKVRALIRTDVSDLDSRYLYFNQEGGLSRFSDTASLEKGFEVRLKNPQRASELKALLLKNGFKTVQTWEDLNGALFYSLKMEKKLMGIFLALAVLVSSFSIMSVLFLLVTEKQKDVGILKAMGARRTQIMRIFISIGLTLGAIGIGGGAVLGVVVCWVLKTYPIIRLPDFYYDTDFPIRMDGGMIVAIILLGGVLAFLSALWPALKISSAQPIDSIRKT